MKTADHVLKEMLETFEERAKLYGDNYLTIGNVMAELFPTGITLTTPEEHNRYHLFLMVMVKMTRLANTNIIHEDSGHDASLYAAMLTGLLKP